MEDGLMARFVGLEISQKLTAICVVDEAERRLSRGQCATDPGQIERTVRGHAGGKTSVRRRSGWLRASIWMVIAGADRRRGVGSVDTYRTHSTVAAIVTTAR